jgi:hypothetical protein
VRLGDQGGTAALPTRVVPAGCDRLAAAVVLRWLAAVVCHTASKLPK